jgi:hypothetical protein
MIIFCVHSSSCAKCTSSYTVYFFHAGDIPHTLQITKLLIVPIFRYSYYCLFLSCARVTDEIRVAKVGSIHIKNLVRIFAVIVSFTFQQLFTLCPSYVFYFRDSSVSHSDKQLNMYKTKSKYALPALATVRCCCSFRDISKVPHNSA